MILMIFLFILNCLTSFSASSSSTSLVCMGDSITAGIGTIGLTPADTFCAKQGVKFGSFVNKGIGGQNSSQMLARFPQDVIALNPTHVTIMTGINDQVSLSAANMKLNLTGMVQQAKAANIKVTIISPPIPVNQQKWTTFGPYLKAIREVVEEQNVDYLPVYERFSEESYSNGGTFPNWYAKLANGTIDTLHPSAIGHQAIVDMCKYHQKVNFCNP